MALPRCSRLDARPCNGTVQDEMGLESFVSLTKLVARLFQAAKQPPEFGALGEKRWHGGILWRPPKSFSRPRRTPPGKAGLDRDWRRGRLVQLPWQDFP